MIGGPQPPRSCLGRFQVKACNVESTKAHGWNQHGILIVAENDTRLTWVEREMIRQLGNKLYGRGNREVYHG